MSEHSSTQKCGPHKKGCQNGPILASSLYDPEQPLATLSQFLKSLELLKTLGRANEDNSRIKYIGIGVEREILRTIQKKTRKRGSIRQVDSRKDVSDGR